MKMSKLFSSIATATMVLTTLAPVAIANAATGYPVNDEGVSKTSSSSASLPAATASGENSDVGSATATSDASVNVIDGYLILQSVPNFGFGAAIAGNTTDLVNYKKAGHGVNDGSESGLLTVIDSRHSGEGTSKSPTQDGRGFDLKVRLGEFKYAPSSTGSHRTNGDEFVLNFKKGGSGLAEEVNPSNHSDRLQVDPTPVVVKELGSDSTLVHAKTGASGGHHTWAFTGSDVSLSVPASAEKGQWYSTMTWTLNASAS